MRKSLRLITILVLAVFVFAMNTSAITILYGSTEEEIVANDWVMGGTVGFAQQLETPIDISGMENLYLRIYLDSADSVAVANSGQLELTSGGTCDVEESAINPLDLDWKDGWNEFVIPIADFVGACDLTRFNYVRLYMFTDADGDPNVSVLDYVAVGNSSDDQSVLVKTDWAIPEAPDPNAKKPDVTNLSATGKGSPWTAVMDNAWGTPMDLSQYESAYIGLYVSNMDNFAPSMGDGQIEFGSAYSCDVEEDAQTVSALGLVSGWNYFEIPLYMIAGGCDYTQFDHFRIYMFFDTPDEEVEVKIDYVAFGPEGMDVGEGKASTFPFVLIKTLAEREADAAAAAAAAEAAAEAAGETAGGEEVAAETPVTDTATDTSSAPATADFGLAASAVMFAAACVAIGILKKRK